MFGVRHGGGDSHDSGWLRAVTGGHAALSPTYISRLRLYGELSDSPRFGNQGIIALVVRWYSR